MGHEIESYFEPDIVWLGEINRRLLQLERDVQLFPPQQTHLHCALWRGREDRVGLALTLSIGDMKLCSRSEDSSPVAATRRAFDELHHQLEKYGIDFQGEDLRPRSQRNRRSVDRGSATRPRLPASYMTQCNLALAHY